MFKIILVCTLSISLITLSCVPVYIVVYEKEIEDEDYPPPVLYPVEPPCPCPPPHRPPPVGPRPRPPGPKPPIERPAIDKPEKINSNPTNHKKRPTTPLRPTRPIRKNPTEQSNQIKDKNKSVVNKKQRGR